MANIIYEINTAIWLGEQDWAKDGQADLAQIPDKQIRQWADMGIDTIWFLGIWKRGEASRRICLEEADLRAGLEQAVPGSVPNHVIGSPFSICDYSISPIFGNESTLPRLRDKLHAHGIRLILDFVPNHMAVDHPWVQEHPERLVRGSKFLITKEPQNYFRIPGNSEQILAHGRDPYFPGWTDTVQINIFSKSARQALTETLVSISDICDGVRCDMAMLVANEVFRRTWGDLSLMDYPSGNPPEFWPEAIAAVKQHHPNFIFAAEVYWGLEGLLQQMGFDLTYDKHLYDRLRAGDASGVRQILWGDQDTQRKMVRFIENHDETRAAKAFGPRQRAAAIAISGLPGQLLFHDGQFDGAMVHAPVQVDIRRQETPDESLRSFYRDLFRIMGDPAIRSGIFTPLAIRSGWEGNETYHAIITYWCSMGNQMRLIVSNIGGQEAQAYTDILLDPFSSPVIEFKDLMGDTCYYRSRKDLSQKGLYLDLAPGACHIFEVRNAPVGCQADVYAE